MSIGPQTALALVRALIVASTAIVVSGPLAAWLGGLRGRGRVVAWALACAPFLTPALLVSYAFTKFALALVASPWSHDALYVVVLAMKLTPVAVLIRAMVPPPISDEARHAFRLFASGSRWIRARFALRAPGAGPWVAAGLVFILAFSDFELASLWSVRTWTVAIFDAQAGGFALGDTLRLAVWPVVVEIGVLALVAWALRPAAKLAPRVGGTPISTTGTHALPGVFARAYVAGAAAFVCFVPMAIVAGQATTGFRAIAGNFVLGREIGASLFFALGAACIASAGGWVSRGKIVLPALFAGFGLLGALVVSLLVLSFFQTPILRAAYDSPVPLLLALGVLLFPLALLLRTLVPERSPALHIARQTGDAGLYWHFEIGPRVAAFALLFYVAYFDFTAGSILAPVGLTPVFVRLHNLAHYGQTSVLSAMLLAAFLAPLATLLIVIAGARLVARGR